MNRRNFQRPPMPDLSVPPPRLPMPSRVPLLDTPRFPPHPLSDTPVSFPPRTHSGNPQITPQHAPFPTRTHSGNPPIQTQCVQFPPRSHSGTPSIQPQCASFPPRTHSGSQIPPQCAPFPPQTHSGTSSIHPQCSPFPPRTHSGTNPIPLQCPPRTHLGTNQIPLQCAPFPPQTHSGTPPIQLPCPPFPPHIHSGTPTNKFLPHANLGNPVPILNTPIPLPHAKLHHPSFMKSVQRPTMNVLPDISSIQQNFDYSRNAANILPKEIPRPTMNVLPESTSNKTDFDSSRNSANILPKEIPRPTINVFPESTSNKTDFDSSKDVDVIPKAVPEEIINVLPEIISNNNLDSSSPKQIEVMSHRRNSPDIQSPLVTKVKFPTLSKEAAKKRLRAFSSAKLIKDQKAKVDGDTASKKDEPVAKKKKVEKKSVIEQIREEETRLKEVLVLHNCNTKYLGTGLAHLQGLMDDPVAFQRFEKKGRDLKKKIEKNELPQSQKERHSRERSSHKSKKHRSGKDGAEAVEKKKKKVIPKSWKQLKSLNVVLSKLMGNEDADSSVILVKSDSRHGSDSQHHFYPLDDKIWMGLSMHKLLVPLRVNRCSGHSKKEYCGSMVRTTVTKPHITFSKNSGKVARHCMTRSESKFRNKTSIGIWNLMKDIWHDKTPLKEYPASGPNTWYVEDWMSFDHDQTLNEDNLTVSGNTALTDLSRKYEDSELSGNECASPLHKKHVDNQSRNDLPSTYDGDKENNSFHVEEELSDGFVDISIDNSPKTDINVLIPTKEEVMIKDEECVVEEIENSVDNSESVETMRNTESVTSSPDRKSTSFDSPNNISIPVQEIEKCTKNTSDNEIDGVNIWEMNLKTVKAVLSSGIISKKKKKLLKEAKKTIKKVKKEKKKMKKERKREKKRQKKLDKMSCQRNKHILPEEEVIPVVAEQVTPQHAEDQKDSKSLYNPLEQSDSECVDDCEQHTDVESLNTNDEMNLSEHLSNPKKIDDSEVEELNNSISLSSPEQQNNSNSINSPIEVHDSGILCNTEPQNDAESINNVKNQSDSESLYNPEEPQISNSNSPRDSFDNEKYSPTSSPFHFSNESAPSPKDSFSYDITASNVEQRIERSLPTEIESPLPIADTVTVPMEMACSSLQNSSSGISSINIDLTSIPTPPSKTIAESRTRGNIAAIPEPVPPPIIPMPVPPVDPQFLQNISSGRKEFIQQPLKEPKLNTKDGNANVKPVAFRLSLNKTPSAKLAKPSLSGLFQEENDERSRELGKPHKLGAKEFFKNLSSVEDSELSLYDRVTETSRTKDIEAIMSSQALYSPSQNENDNKVCNEEIASEIPIATDKEIIPKMDSQDRPQSRGSKHSISPSRQRRKRSSSSPSRRHRERSRSRSPQRHSRGGYSSRSKRSPPRYKRSRSRSPRRSGVRHRDERRNSKGSYDRHSRSPSPRRGQFDRLRDTEKRTSPRISTVSGKKISAPTSETIPTADIKKIESITNMGEGRGNFNVDLSEIILPTDTSYGDDTHYTKHSEDSFYDSLNSPKRPSLADRLRDEHGLYLEDSPSQFDNSSNAFATSDPQNQQEYWENIQPQPVGGPARVIQVGNVLQILPQELPPLEEPQKELNVQQIKAIEPNKPKASKNSENYSVVPLSPSFSPPPEGRISPLPPPSPSKTISPKDVPVAVVGPVMPVCSGPIPGLSSEALISAAAAASAAANVPFAHLISVLQEQNLLPKSVAVPEQTEAVLVPAKQPSPVQQPEESKDKIDLETLRKDSRERKIRKRQEKEKRRDERKRQREAEMARQVAIQQAEEDDDEALIKEAISEVPELEGPVPDMYLMDDEDDKQVNPIHHSLSLPPPDKGILVLPTYKDDACQPHKSVWFGDGIIPGEGTSASGEEENISETPAKSVKRKKKKDRSRKNKPKTYDIKVFDSNGDGICSPPPPPECPPPPDAIKLYPGWFQCTYTAPDDVILYTQKLLNPAVEPIQDAAVMIPPGMLIHSAELNATGS